MEASFHIIDYLVVLAFLILFAGMGMWFSNRQDSTTHYYSASGTLPSWAIGLSILATLISSITFLAYPGEGFDSNWILLVQGMMIPPVLIFLVFFIVPFYRKVIGISAYEYFEKRFGYIARLYTALAFAMAHFSKMGTVFFLLSLAISSMLEVNIYIIILVLGFAVIFYTLVGGIEAVVWLDVVQGIMLLFGGILAIIVMYVKAPATPVEMIDFAWQNEKIGFGPYDWDFTRLTFFVMAFNGIFYAIQKYGTDQTIVQRYLTARSHKEAIKASLYGVLFCVPVWMLFMFVGSMLFSFYNITDIGLPEGIRADSVFPHFILHELPIGITGLIVSGLIAAAFSSLDSDLNSLSAVGVSDFYKRFFPDHGDRRYLIVGRIIVIVCGIGALGISILYVLADDETVLGIIFTLYAIFSGGIAGLFLLGIFTKRANKHGLNVAIVATILFTGWAMLTSQPVGVAEQPLLDLGKYNYTHHSYMLGVYTHFVMFGVGYFASLLFPKYYAEDNLTIYGYLKERKEIKEE